MPEDVIKSLHEVQDLAEAVMIAQGFSEAQAGAIARNVTGAERDECRHHGLEAGADYVG